MELSYIYATFKALETVTEKVTYIKELETLNLPYEINFSGLVAAWERITVWYKILPKGAWQLAPFAVQ